MKINDCIVQNQNMVQKQNFLKLLFNFPQVNPWYLDANPIIYKDLYLNYTCIMLSSKEFILQINFILLTSSFELVLGNHPISLFASYLIQQFLIFIYSYFTKRSLEQTTLVKDCFLK